MNQKFTCFFYFKRIKTAIPSRIKITPTVISKIFKIVASPRLDSGSILLMVVDELDTGRLDEPVCVVVLVEPAVSFPVVLFVTALAESIWFILISAAKLMEAKDNRNTVMISMHPKNCKLLFFIFINKPSFMSILFCFPKNHITKIEKCQYKIDIIQ